MGLKDIFGKISGSEGAEGLGDDYLELDEGDEFTQFDMPVRSIKVCKLKGFADVDIAARELSEGNIVIIDIKPLADRSMTELKHAVDEMKDIATSMGGDIAGLTELHLILTPPSVKIERDDADSKTRAFEATMERVKQQ